MSEHSREQYLAFADRILRRERAMSMTIGKDAREALKDALEKWMRGANHSSLMQTVDSVFDRCTDAPEVGMPPGMRQKAGSSPTSLVGQADLLIPGPL